MMRKSIGVNLQIIPVMYNQHGDIDREQMGSPVTMLNEVN